MNRARIIMLAAGRVGTERGIHAFGQSRLCFVDVSSTRLRAQYMSVPSSNGSFETVMLAIGDPCRAD